MSWGAALSMLSADHLLGDLPHLRDWWSRVSARASWATVLGLA